MKSIIISQNIISIILPTMFYTTTLKKKKIAFVIPGLEAGGAERVVTTLANELCLQYEVIIITLSDFDSFYKLDPLVKHIKCSDNPLISKNIFKALINNFHLLLRLYKFFKIYNINLSIGFLPTANILTIIASSIYGIPCIVNERSNPNVEFLNKFWKNLRRLSYKKADFIVIQTKNNLSYFSKFTRADKLLVLPNPLSNQLIKSKNKNHIKQNIILSVGRLDKNKSQDLLIRAFSKINNQDWKLYLVGDGVEKNNYITLAKSLKLEEKVIFKGHSSKISKFYNSSKIFAFTSKSEGFPNALIEAMYFELPCISTDCPYGPSEIIKDSYNGFLIPINDQKALEKKLTLLMSSEKIRKKIGENAYESTTCFLTNKVITQWDTLIRKLI